MYDYFIIPLLALKVKNIFSYKKTFDIKIKKSYNMIIKLLKIKRRI